MVVCLIFKFHKYYIICILYQFLIFLELLNNLTWQSNQIRFIFELICVELRLFELFMMYELFSHYFTHLFIRNQIIIIFLKLKRAYLDYSKAIHLDPMNTQIYIYRVI